MDAEMRSPEGRPDGATTGTRPVAEHLVAMLRAEPDRLRRRSLSLGVPPGDADDAAQNVALRAWRSLDALHSPDVGSMCAWLDSIARTTAIDMHRARRATLGEVLCDRLESGQDVEAEAETGARLAATLRSIERLPADLRQPLVRSVVDGASGAEIAEELGISPAAVRQRIARARKALADGAE